MKYYYKLNDITIMCNGWTGKVESCFKTRFENNIRYDEEIQLKKEEINNIIKNGKSYEAD